MCDWIYERLGMESGCVVLVTCKKVSAYGSTTIDLIRWSISLFK